MNKLYSFFIPALLALPAITQAQLTEDGDGGPLGGFLLAATGFIFGPLLTFLLAIAFIAFAWGVLKYFIATADDDKTKAKSLMLYGIGGFVLILVLFGLVNLLVDFLGLGGGSLETSPGISNSN